MKQSQVKPGVRAMLSLGRRGAVAVTVVRERFAAGTINDRAFWIVADSHGTEHSATARQLSPVPVTSAAGVLLGHLGRDGGVYPPIAGKRFTGLGYETV
jgi:hypothetical protein